MKPHRGYKTFENTSTNVEEDECYQNIEEFEDILELVGSHGKYQKCLLYGLLCPFSFLLPLFVMNTTFLYTVPDHWCHVPLPIDHNATSPSLWKNLTIPREFGPDGLERFSQCNMYVSPHNHSLVPCQHGWDYDKSQLDGTMATHNDWVCDRSDLITIALMAGIVGSLLGTFICGWTGDKWGRKPSFFGCCFLLSVFRYLSLWVPGTFGLYLVAEMLLSAAYPMVFVIIYSIAVEIFDKELRSWVYGLRWSSWVCGICVLPLVSWLTRDYYLFGTLTSLPLLLTFCFYGYIPESPRWLLTQNRVEEAKKILEQIASTNGTGHKFGPGQLERLLHRVKDKQDEINSGKNRSSIWTLFSKKRLARNTILLSFSSAANVIVYYGITFRTTSLSGNQFLNFFLLAIVELPAGWFGWYFAEKAGRRWSQTFAHAACAAGFGLAVFGTVCPDHFYLVVPSLMFCKFFVSTTSMIFPLQAAEIFPTEHRAMGYGFAIGFAETLNLATPPILLMAMTETSLTYLAFLVVAVIGTVASAFLPETLHRSLPETIEEANSIGQDVPFWSFLPKPKTHVTIPSKHN